jgi:hypothetical protein
MTVRHDGAKRRRLCKSACLEQPCCTRVGPSGSDCRIRVQTTVSCFGPMAEVVSVTEKAGDTRQVRAGKTNASEPLMTCRKHRDVAKTRLQSLAWDEARRKPARLSERRPA